MHVMQLQLLRATGHNEYMISSTTNSHTVLGPLIALEKFHRRSHTFLQCYMRDFSMTGISASDVNKTRMTT